MFGWLNRDKADAHLTMRMPQRVKDRLIALKVELGCTSISGVAKEAFTVLEWITRPCLHRGAKLFLEYPDGTREELTGRWDPKLEEKMAAHAVHHGGAGKPGTPGLPG